MSFVKDLFIAKVTQATQTGGSTGPGPGNKNDPIDKNGVNFIDYDGSLLYSYTVEEFQKVTELPPLPEHEGLICQGWNWTLEDIKADGKETDVGATYITDDGKTRLCITTGSDNLSVVLCITASGTVDVDWGDGSAIEQLTGAIEQTHVYTNAGDYTITLDSANDLYLGKDVNYYPVVYIPLSNGAQNRLGTSLLRKVYIGNCVTKINRWAFENCYSLSSITIPNGVTLISGWTFYNCYSLSSIIIPNSVRSIEQSLFCNCYSLTRIIIPNSVKRFDINAFHTCYSLTRIKIPNSVKKIEGGAFQSCFSLTSITIPNSVTSIDSQLFYGCYSLTGIKIHNSVTWIGNDAFCSCCVLKLIDFSAHTTVPALYSTSAFSDIPVPFEIRVPAALYDEWIAATNWSTYADYIVAV